MKKVIWVIPFILLLQACATHVPLSQSVMFNTTEPSVVDEEYDAGFAITAKKHGVEESHFIQKQNENYDTESEFPIPINATILVSNRDQWGWGLSMVHGFGMDGTVKIFDEIFATASISANRSRKLIIQQRLMNKNNIGISFGGFWAYDTKNYYKRADCGTFPCLEFDPTPDGKVGIRSVGLSSNLFLRFKPESKFGILGGIDIGRLFEIDESYVSLNVSLIGF
ncbi:MAG: hypothetical protein JJ895_03690 [Balneolaceae bacterium]|nr:hypothetical protein [Balneolaceae bacterium]